MYTNIYIYMCVLLFFLFLFWLSVSINLTFFLLVLQLKECFLSGIFLNVQFIVILQVTRYNTKL